MKVVKVFYDLETTGTEPNKHSIIQLAGLVEVNDEVVEEFDFKLRPHLKAKIEPEALSVNGHTIEEIMGYPDMKIAYKQFTAMLDKYSDRYSKTDKVYLVGFNNRKFDDLFLHKLFELCGDRFFFGRFWTDTLDTIVLASQFLIKYRPNMPSFKLRRVATELGLTVIDEDLHDAAYDIRLTRSVYRILVGLDPRPWDKFRYYHHAESGAVFKAFEPCDDIQVDEIDFDKYKELLVEYGEYDGPEKIQDDLM